MFAVYKVILKNPNIQIYHQSTSQNFSDAQTPQKQQGYYSIP